MRGVTPEKMSTICDAALSHCPWVLLGFPFHHVFSDEGRKHWCPGSNFASNAATRYGVVHTGLCVAFLGPTNIWPVKIPLNMLLDVKSKSSWSKRAK